MNTALAISLDVTSQAFPYKTPFRIARGHKTEAKVVMVTLTQGPYQGVGEATPYARYGETMDLVMSQIESVRKPLKIGLSRIDLQALLPAGAARNAIDCALWDLEAKRSHSTPWELAKLPIPKPVTTAYTLILDTPQAMGKVAGLHNEYPYLKLKLTGVGDLARVASVHRNAPKARLIVDANEAWNFEELRFFSQAFCTLGVVLIEQPLKAQEDGILSTFKSPIPLCADESFHTQKDFPSIAHRYDAINIKLDKTGGLTQALHILKQASALKLKIMIGCMASTSLSMAPAYLLTGNADFVDLDGPLLLAKDRKTHIRYKDSLLYLENNQYP